MLHPTPVLSLGERGVMDGPLTRELLRRERRLKLGG